MVTICGVAENEGAKQMRAALIKWPLMNEAMKQVWRCSVLVSISTSTYLLHGHSCIHVCAEQTGGVAICRQERL